MTHALEGCSAYVSVSPVSFKEGSEPHVGLMTQGVTLVLDPRQSHAVRTSLVYISAVSGCIKADSLLLGSSWKLKTRRPFLSVA